MQCCSYVVEAEYLVHCTISSWVFGYPSDGEQCLCQRKSKEGDLNPHPRDNIQLTEKLITVFNNFFGAVEAL